MSDTALTVTRARREYQRAESGYKTKALYRLRDAVLAELKNAVTESSVVG